MDLDARVYGGSIIKVSKFVILYLLWNEEGVTIGPREGEATTSNSFSLFIGTILEKSTHEVCGIKPKSWK